MFWRPVGQGSLARKRTEYSIATLFAEGDGLEQLDRTVTRRARQMPGFSDLTKTTERFGTICRKFFPARAAAMVSLFFSIDFHGVV
jgi:hypothetical protein